MPNNAESRTELVYGELSYAIVGAFFSVYNRLGFGFLESVYLKCVEILLRKKGLRVEREVPVEIAFEGELVGSYRIDMLVERCIIVETKATERLSDFARVQLRNYLAASGLRLGLILHFGPKPAHYRVLGPSRVRAIVNNTMRIPPTQTEAAESV